MRITENSPQWLRDLAKDNLRREVELHNRQHDICLYLVHDEEYKRKNGLKPVQSSLVPLDYLHNTVNVF